MAKRISLLFILFQTSLQAQNVVAIHGFVQDAQTSERLIGAVIWQPKLKKGTSTNKQGYFSLTLPSDTTSLWVSFVGYAPQKLPPSRFKGAPIVVNLVPISQNVVVEVQARRREDEFTQMSVINLPVSQVQRTPTILGEQDVFKILQLMPGVKGGMEGSSNFYVRGGGADQNLILLDGTPIYNPLHLFGFFSVINAGSIKDVEVYKGAFPARYGGRLSSVIDITTKDGRKNKLHAEANLGMISNTLAIEGPLYGKKGSFSVSGRLSNLSLWLNLLQNKDPNSPRLKSGFNDFNAKLSADLSKKDRIYLSRYSSEDNFQIKSSTDILTQSNQLNWKNKLRSIYWIHILNSKLLSSTRLYQTNYDVSVESSNNSLQEKVTLSYSSSIQEKGLKSDWEYKPSTIHYVRFGFYYNQHKFNPGTSFYKKNGVSDTLITSRNFDFINNLYALYLENEIRITEKYGINLGLNTSYLRTPNADFVSVEPRLGVRLKLPYFTLKSGYVHMQQPMHLAVSSGIGLPTDMWFPVTSKLKPQTSKQFSLGLAKSLPKFATELSIEGYYKTMQNMVEYKSDALVFLELSDNIETLLLQGKGTSYGLEALAHKKEGAWSGWLGYTLSHTNRLFEGLNDGASFPFRYDRRHDVSIVINYQFPQKHHFGIVWVYGTGNPITLPESAYETIGFKDNMGINYDIQKINGHRLDASHRLDISFKFNISPKGRDSGIVIGVYNIYNRKNPVFAYATLNSNLKLEFRQVSMIPLLPYLNFNLKI